MTGGAVPSIPECAGAAWVPAFFSPDFCRICENGFELENNVRLRGLCGRFCRSLDLFFYQMGFAS